jgi:putative flippase GtrA
MEKIQIVYIYAAIATVASLTNLLLQFLFLRVYTGNYAVELSIIVATAVILPFKYVSDKKLIFKFTALGAVQNFWKFANYTFVSIFTVAIFWGIEYAAHLLVDHAPMRYLAGAFGLTVSFYLKYMFDRRYVFVKKTK